MREKSTTLAGGGDPAARLRAALPTLDPALRGAVADLLARHDADALREAAMEATSEGISISDMRLPDAPLIYVNGGFERLTGHRRDRVLGRNCRFLQGPDTDPAAVDTLRRAIRLGQGCTVDLLNYRADGAPFWNRLSLTPLRDAGGAVTHYVGIQSDVTTQVEANREVRQALELLEATNRKVTAANQRMKRNLEAAARIQQAMLPDTLPEHPGYAFAWKYLPSEELAGDTLNIFQLDARHVAFYLLDVTGHGTAAALLAVAVSRILAPAPNSSSVVWEPDGPRGLRITDPVDVATELNYLFPWDADTGQFFTLVYGVLDMESGEVRFVTAGHPGPLHLRADGGVIQAPTEGMPIGLASEPYRGQRLRLDPGDRLVLYSDGIVEVMSPGGRLFGRARLLEAIACNTCRALDATLNHLLDTAQHWRGSRRFQDDLSLVAIERRP